mgnify:FL=1
MSWQNSTPLMELGHRSAVTLVRNEDNKLLAVRRTVNAAQAEIYRVLQGAADPHLPLIYEIAPMENDSYAVFEECVSGRTLAEVLRECGTLDEQTAAYLAAQLCQVLTVIHRAGLIHRDIKPSNIMVTDENHLYLIDFDISRSHKSGKSADTELLGTQGYAAPEQFGFRQTDVRTDVYAVGVLLNQMLTGMLPQEQLTDGSLRKVIRRCVDIDPERRYQSASAVGHALRPYQPGRIRLRYILRGVPGFRTWTPWKMVCGMMFYLFGVGGVIAEFFATPNPSILAGVLVIVVYGWLFCYIFDCFHMRSRIGWLKQARSRIGYIARCVAVGIGIYIGLLIVSAVVLAIVYSG